MVTTEQMIWMTEALQEDWKDLPPCGHAACILIDIVGIDKSNDAECERFLGWVDVGMNDVIEAIALAPSSSGAIVKSELAVWYAKGIMLGKKLARVDDAV